MKAKLSLLFVIGFICLSLFSQAQTSTIQHKVEAGQTLYFISKKYNVSIAELRASNPAIGEDLIIKPGQDLKIPVKNTVVKLDESNYKIHVVKTKETLYSISKLYNVSVDDLISMNNLDNPSISVGQEIRVQKLNVDNQAIYVKPEVKPTTTVTPEVKTPTAVVTPITPVVAPSKTPEKEIEASSDEDVTLYKQLFDAYNQPGNTLNKDKGIGNYLDGTSTGAYLAMVNNVPAGQIIKLRNLMNNKVIYLKVVGPLSTKETDKNISIKISKSAAVDLNIIEDRFLSEWTWYTISGAKPSTDGTFKDF
jgi:LysM repeat protein